MPIDLNLEKGLPSAIDAERSILGGILLDSASYYNAAAARGLHADAFALESHRRLYRVMESIAQRGGTIDLITVSEELTRKGETGSVGGVAYVSSLMDGLPRRPSIEGYVDIVLERALRRDYIHTMNSLTAAALQEADTTNDLLAITHEKMLKLMSQTQRELAVRLGDISDDILRNLKRLRAEGRKVLGLTYGIRDVDKATTGMRPKEMTVCAAFTGGGKTALGCGAVADNVLVGVPSVIFTREMDREQIGHRIWSRVADMKYSKFRNPVSLQSDDLDVLEMTKRDIDSLPLLIDDEENYLDELVARAHYYVAEHKVQLIVVDYLQLIDVRGVTKDYERISMVARALRRLAKTTGAHVLALSQLSRPDDKQKLNIRPNLRLLRGSGEIEQHAHVVMFGYREMNEDVYSQTGDIEPTGNDEIIIGKQRAGVLGPEKVKFDKHTLTFRDRDFERIEHPVQPSLL